jgi:hypothetical protein
MNKLNHEIQSGALKVFGFVTDSAKRNLIITILVVSWGVSAWAVWALLNCEKRNSAELQAKTGEMMRLVEKYELKIETLNERFSKIEK